MHQIFPDLNNKQKTKACVKKFLAINHYSFFLREDEFQPVDKERKMNVLCTFSWRPVSRGNPHWHMMWTLFSKNGRGKLCGNFTFSQNFHTRKLGEVLVFYVVILKIFYVCSGVQEFISTHFALCGRRDFSSVLKLQTEIRRLQKILKMLKCPLKLFSIKDHSPIFNDVNLSWCSSDVKVSDQ